MILGGVFLNREDIDLLEKEKIRLLSKVNDLLEGLLDEKDDEVRDTTSELVRKLKDNIREIDEKISFAQSDDEEEDDEDSEGSDDEEGDDVEEDEDIEEEEEEIEYEYTGEPKVSIGRSDGGDILAVYDKRKRKK